MRARARVSGCLCVGVVALAACGKTETRATDTTTPATTMSPPPATTPAGGTLSLADVAGRWSMRSVPTTGDSTPTTFELRAAADTTGWTMTFPNRAPVAMHVRVDGDSIIGSAGPYESVRRKGVTVRTNSVLRLVGGRLVGTTVAHYQKAGPDSLLQLRTEGTRMP